MLKHHDRENVKELGLDDLKKSSFKPLFCLSTKPLAIQVMENTASFFWRSIHMHTKLFLDLLRTNLKSCRMSGVYKLDHATTPYSCHGVFRDLFVFRSKFQ